MTKRRRKQQRDLQAPIIKFSAVFAAVTRWTGALLAGEGFSIPEDWMVWWLPASALLSAFMAVVEGWAFAYIFQAWWVMRNRERQRGAGGMSKVLLALTIFAAVTFVLVLTPYIAAQAQGSSMYQVASQSSAEPILSSKLWLMAWSACVAASTISVVASVGIAQGAKAEEIVEVKQAPAKEEEITCNLCKQKFASAWTLWGHLEGHRREITEAGNLPNAIKVLTEKYGQVDGEVLAEWQREL